MLRKIGEPGKGREESQGKRVFPFVSHEHRL